MAQTIDITAMLDNFKAWIAQLNKNEQIGWILLIAGFIILIIGLITY